MGMGTARDEKRATPPFLTVLAGGVRKERKGAENREERGLAGQQAEEDTQGARKGLRKAGVDGNIGPADGVGTNDEVGGEGRADQPPLPNLVPFFFLLPGLPSP